MIAAVRAVVQAAIGLRGHPMDEVARVEVPLEDGTRSDAFVEKAIVGLRPSFSPTYRISCIGPPNSVCGFLKEPMKFVNASKLDRKSGVRSGERGAPADFLSFCIRDAPGLTLILD